MSHHHFPRKRFGQHFLIDRLVIESIVKGIDPHPGQVILEIGPGLGALTEPLLLRAGHLTVIEIDRDLAAQLQAETQINVIQDDVLKVDFSRIAESVKPQKLRVVGNLPYNISTPILFHLLQYVHSIEDQHFMLQKEVVDRMVAKPSTSAYGRLSVMLQWRYSMQTLLLVPPNSFKPPPRVDSAVIRMVPLEHPVVVDHRLLSEIVQVAFSQRRKIMRHTLGRWLEERGFAGEFDIQRRAEEVPVAEYINLTQMLSR